MAVTVKIHKVNVGGARDVCAVDQPKASVHGSSSALGSEDVTWDNKSGDDIVLFFPKGDTLFTNFPNAITPAGAKVPCAIIGKNRSITATFVGAGTPGNRFRYSIHHPVTGYVIGSSDPDVEEK